MNQKYWQDNPEETTSELLCASQWHFMRYDVVIIPCEPLKAHVEADNQFSALKNMRSEDG